MSKYQIGTAGSFDSAYNKLVKNNKQLVKKFDKAKDQLSIDPFYPSLNTHKIYLSNGNFYYSSWVTGNIRIFWQFNEENKLVILLYETGGHDKLY